MHGARRPGQEGSLAAPPGKVVKCFDALVITVKCSVDKLFMHYFQNIRRFLWLRRQTHIRASFMDAAGPPDLPTLGKNPAGAHVCVIITAKSMTVKRTLMLTVWSIITVN